MTIEPMTVDLTTGPSTTEVVAVDAELARRWLEGNTHNRPLRSAQVEKYVRDMTGGRWEFAGDPIRFAADGTLLDGQHRLTALSQLTTPWVERWVAEHPQEVELLTDVVIKPILRTDATPSVAGAAAIGFFGVDQEATAVFFDLLASGAGTEGHPIVTLDKRLAQNRRRQVVMPHRDQLAMFIQAWNAWRSNRQLSKFQRPVGGSWSLKNYPTLTANG